jgi:S-adenosylmethionine-dependent methyltransferase
MDDHNFDELADDFARNVYASDKGRLRLALLQQELQVLLDSRQGKVLRVLDAGAGLGQMALWLAEQGHEVTACDISARMLASTRAACDRADADVNVTCIHAPLQDLPDRFSEGFDLVLCHAVLEWLADPAAAIPVLKTLVRPGGMLSLMFFNSKALEFSHLLCGNFTRVFEGRLAGDGSNLLPTNPQNPYQVCDWLEQSGLHIESRAGIRVLRDYMMPRVRGRLTFEQLLQVELRYRHEEPYCWLGRYFHVLCRRDG